MLDQSEILALISSIPLFAGLDEEDLEALAAAFRSERYPANSVVYRQGDPGSVMYVMTSSGRGILLQASADGMERKVGTVRQGDVVGASSLFVEDERDVTFLMVKPGILCSLSRANFNAVTAVHAGIIPRLDFEGREDLRRLQDTRSFSWLRPGEATMLSTRRHRYAFYIKAFFTLVLGGMSLLVPLALARITEAMCVAQLGFVGILLLIVGALGFFYQDWRNDYFVVTNQRVVHEERVFAFLGQQTIRQASLENVEGVVVEQEGPAARSVGFADVRIETAGPEGSILFRQVPIHHAEDFREQILNLHRRHVSRTAAERRAEIRREIERRLGVDLQHQGAEDEYGDEDDLFIEELAGRAAPPPQPRLGLRGMMRNFWRGAAEYLTPRIRIESGETVTYRKHWVNLMQSTCLTITLTSILTVLFVLRILDKWPPIMNPLEQLITPPIAVIGFVILFALGVGRWWYGYEDWRNDLYQITPTSVVDLKTSPLFFGERRFVEAPLANIQSVTAHTEGALGRMLRIGRVVIETAGAEGTLEWVDVHAPDLVAEDVSRRQRAFIMQREEDRELEQADLLAEWIAIYHQTTHPEAYAGDERATYHAWLGEDEDEDEDEDHSPPPSPGGPPDTGSYL